ncbi:MAG: FAD-dependent oxidoreductase [Cyanobacteria bacterium HKST-UBA05]|nr:FAD-dependent oxidoreductase [Cyanobacteria bacterium HKST-UBA05]
MVNSSSQLTRHSRQQTPERQAARPSAGQQHVDTFDVVVIGGGIGGFTLAKAMMKADRASNGHRHKQPLRIRLIDPQPAFIFRPYLYETLNGRQPSVDRKPFFDQWGEACQYVQGSAEWIEWAPSAETKSILHTTQGPLPFNVAVLATGPRPNYYNIEGARQHTIPLLNPNHMARFQHAIDERLEQLAQIRRKQPYEYLQLPFYIIGAGPSGVELSFELNTYLHRQIVEHYPQELASLQPDIRLIEAEHNILPMASEKEQAIVMQHLLAAGIHVHSNNRVKLVTDTTLITESTHPDTKEVVETSWEVDLPPIWLAGIQANIPPRLLPENTEQLPGSDRVCVNDWLEIPGHANMYVIGDAAGVTDASGSVVPASSQATEQMAQYVADDILQYKRRHLPQRRKGFVFKNKGQVVSLGQHKAMLTPELLPKIPGLFDNLTMHGRHIAWLRQTYYDAKLT